MKVGLQDQYRRLGACRGYQPIHLPLNNGRLGIRIHKEELSKDPETIQPKINKVG